MRGPGPALKRAFPVPSFGSLASRFIHFIIIICLLFLVSDAFGNLIKIMDFQKNTLVQSIEWVFPELPAGHPQC